MNKKNKKLLVNDLQKAKAVLKNINWNFYQKSSLSSFDIQPFNCRLHHWYPATFIPELPFTLIEVLTLPNAVVFDPFAGSGTTYFQALLLNRKPLATEICKVAVEYMRSLFILFNPEINIKDLKKRVNRILEDFNLDIDYTSNIPKYGSIDILRPWYSFKTLNQLSFLFAKEEECNDKIAKAAILIAISASLKTVSSQNRGWGCVADNVLPRKNQIRDKDVFNLFIKNLNRLLNDISEHLNNTMSNYDQLYKELSETETIFHKDIKKLKEIQDNSVDLVVTSPPYPNMTDYATSQRLSYYYFGVDLINDLNNEIGARRRRRRKDSIEQYFKDMKRANEIISRKIKSGGYACYVMPVFNTDKENDRIRGRIIQKVLSNMEENDLIKEDEYERILPSIQRSHNIKWATLEREKIYLYRRI